MALQKWGAVQFFSILSVLLLNIFWTKKAMKFEKQSEDIAITTIVSLQYRNAKS